MASRTLLLGRRPDPAPRHEHDARDRQARPRRRGHRHLLADLWGCPPDLLNDAAHIQAHMLEAARRGGATVVDSTFHRFEGGGITGVVAVKESHLTIHTWPRRGYAAVDIFLCGRTRPRTALAHLVKALGAQRTNVRGLRRGRDAEAPPSSAAAGTAAHAAGGRSMTVLYALTMVVAMCSIVYELLLAQTLSALLGNTVLRYSITIGCYLGALGLGAILCGSNPERPGRRLVWVELALSALGGASVLLFYLFDMGQRYVYLIVEVGSVWETLAPMGFLFATHVVIVGIGLLSGFEIPLLLALGERAKPHSTNRILGVDYFGALVGSVLFPLLFLRSFGLIATAFVVALANVLAAGILLAWQPLKRRGSFALVTGALAAGLIVGFVASDRIEQYFLKKFYFVEDTTDGLAALFRPSDRPEVVRYRSPYQTIDLIKQSAPEQWVYDIVSDAPHDVPGKPDDLWLFLERDYQFFSGMEEIYHEWFVHGAVQGTGTPPHRVLVLGGGDGLAIREALKYGTVERLVHVDIDPVMIRLAAEHPALSAMNGHVDRDPRVETVQDDAFHWLRTTDERFDAVFIDMPYARDYNLSQVYSREFYSLVRHHLDPAGFVAIDTPDGWCKTPGGLWDVYYSTLRAAGFPTVVPLVSRFDLDAPRIEQGIEQTAATTNMTMPVPGSPDTVQLTVEQKKAYIRGSLEADLEGVIQEFTLAYPVQRDLDTEWHDFGVPLHAFGPAHLPLAFDDGCDTEVREAKVNSIFRPTLPELALLTVALP